MKKLKHLIIASMLVLFSSLIFVGCDDDPKNPNLMPTIDTDTYYLTTQTLEDVVISLGENSTLGTIDWIDSSVSIQLGEHEYEYKFTPNDKDYKSVNGTVKIRGYELVDLSSLTIGAKTAKYDGTSKRSSISFAELDDQNVSWELIGDLQPTFVAVYDDMQVRITAKENKVLQVIEDSTPVLCRSITKNFTFTITKGDLDNAQVNIQSWTFGGDPSVPTLSNVEGINENYITYTYEKKLDEETYDTANATTTAPTAVGEYRVKAVIPPTDYYNGKIVYEPFSIIRKTIPTVANLDSTEFNGLRQVPTIAIPDLIIDTDYSVGWSYKPFNGTEFVAISDLATSFVNAGQYKATITGNGNYKGGTSVIYEIARKTIPSINTIAPTTYTGSSLIPTVAIEGIDETNFSVVGWEYKSFIATEFTSYPLSATESENFINAGTYRVTLRAKNDSNYSGEKTAEYVINRTNRTSTTKTAITYPRVYNYEDDTTINPSVTNNLENGAITYYYNTVKSNGGGTVWTTDTILGAGTYYLYAKVAATTNYNEYITPTIDFICYRTKEVSTVAEYDAAQLNNDYNIIKIINDMQVVNLKPATGKKIIIDEGVTVTYTGDRGTVTNNGTTIALVSTRAAFIYGIQIDNIVKLCGNITDGEGDITIVHTAGFMYPQTSVIDLNGYGIDFALNITNTNRSNAYCIFNITIQDTSEAQSGYIGKIDADVDYGLFIENGVAPINATIKDITIQGTSGIHTNGTRSGATITMTNCKIQANETSGLGGYLAANYTYNFTDTTFTGATGLYLKSGSYDFAGCTFTGKGESANIVANGNGTSSTGDALTFESATGGYTTTLNITIDEDCEFISTNGNLVQRGCTATQDYANVIVYVDSREELMAGCEYADKIILKADLNGGLDEDLSIAPSGYNINVTLDLNGYSIHNELDLRNNDLSTTTVDEREFSLDITIINSSENLSTIGHETNAWYGILVNSNENVTITIEGTNKNIKLLGNRGGFYTNGLSKNSTITITSVIMVGAMEADASDIINCAGAYLAGGHTYVFTNCEFIGGNGIYMKSQSLTLNNCSLTGTSIKRDVLAYGNGFNATGDAIMIEIADGYTQPVTVIINGGTFVTTNGGYKIHQATTDTTPINGSTIRIDNVTLTTDDYTIEETNPSICSLVINVEED